MKILNLVRCAGSCVTGDCDCGLYNGASVPTVGEPPFHEGCECYIEEHRFTSLSEFKRLAHQRGDHARERAIHERTEQLLTDFAAMLQQLAKIGRRAAKAIATAELRIAELERTPDGKDDQEGSGQEKGPGQEKLASTDSRNDGKG